MIGKPKVNVAGAGALGLVIALKLADAGCDVAVFDPAEDADNASGVAAGMLAPAFESILDPGSAGHFPLLLAARDLWPAFADRAGVALDRAGAIWAGDAATADLHARALQALGLSPESLDRSGLRARAPALSSDVEAGLYSAADWRVEPVAAIAALRRAASSAGVTFHRALAPHDLGDRLVIATGASRSLADRTPELERLTPIKGHILRFDAPAPPGPVVRGEGVYLVPAASGVIVGATMEAGVSDRAVDAGRAAGLARAGARLFPSLAGQPFGAATGVRAATPDGLPLVGPSLAPDVILAVGARRNGWLLAPLVAQIVVAAVLGDEPGQFGGRLAPSRFPAT